eukprot:12788595-Alexandrium_andersonii.AAC.1
MAHAGYTQTVAHAMLEQRADRHASTQASAQSGARACCVEVELASEQVGKRATGQASKEARRHAS